MEKAFDLSCLTVFTLLLFKQSFNKNSVHLPVDGGNVMDFLPAVCNVNYLQIALVADSYHLKHIILIE